MLFPDVLAILESSSLTFFVVAHPNLQTNSTFINTNLKSLAARTLIFFSCFIKSEFATVIFDSGKLTTVAAESCFEKRSLFLTAIDF